MSIILVFIELFMIICQFSIIFNFRKIFIDIFYLIKIKIKVKIVIIFDRDKTIS